MLAFPPFPVCEAHTGEFGEDGLEAEVEAVELLLSTAHGTSEASSGGHGLLSQAVEATAMVAL